MIDKKAELKKFTQITYFCSSAQNDIFKKINQIILSSSELQVSIKYDEDSISNNISEEDRKNHEKNISDNKNILKHNAETIVKLTILSHSINLVQKQLQALGGPFKVKNKDSYRLLSFWEKNNNQSKTFFTNQENIKRIAMTNKLYNGKDYSLDKVNDFVINFTRRETIDKIIKPVDYSYVFMKWASLALFAALITATVFVAIYTNSITSWILLIALPPLAIESLYISASYAYNHNLLNKEYNPITKTNSILDMSHIIDCKRLKDTHPEKYSSIDKFNILIAEIANSYKPSWKSESKLTTNTDLFAHDGKFEISPIANINPDKFTNLSPNL